MEGIAGRADCTSDETCIRIMLVEVDVSSWDLVFGPWMVILLNLWGDAEDTMPKDARKWTLDDTCFFTRKGGKEQF